MIKIKEYDKQYYQNNKEKINNYYKDLYPINRDESLLCSKIYYKNNQLYSKTKRNTKNELKNITKIKKLKY